MPSARSTLLLMITALVGGCAVGPDYYPPSASDLRLPTGFGAPVPVHQTDGADLGRWWQAFDDPLLTYFIERGLGANLDIEVAGARLRQARAALRAYRGAFWPSLGVGGSVTRTAGRDTGSFVDNNGTLITTGGDETLYQASFDADYEVDVFGGVRRQVEAGRADAQAAEADLHSVQLSVVSEIALNYLDARLTQERLRIASANLRAQDDTLQLVGWRVQAGLVSSLDLEQARALRSQTAASIPLLEGAYAAAVNRVSVLLGEAPREIAALFDRPGGVPLAPASLSAAIPAAVIQRRPDIAAAERTLAGEVARVGVQEAQLYPALRLAGSFAGSGTSLDALGESAIGNFIGAITVPIFQGGQLRAAVEGQRASADAAFASYRQAVLLALEEADNALTGVATAERREEALIEAADAARAAALLARSQYQAGLIDFQALLESERNLLSSQDSRAVARADRATATVQLYKALGGGWEAAPLPRTVTTSIVTEP